VRALGSDLYGEFEEHLRSVTRQCHAGQCKHDNRAAACKRHVAHDGRHRG